jgi:hypothetical protein
MQLPLQKHTGLFPAAKGFAAGGLVAKPLQCRMGRGRCYACVYIPKN